MSFGYYGPSETWKVVYVPNEMNAGIRGVAFVEADCQQGAMVAFREQYSGQYSVIEKCEKLLG